MYLIFNFSVSFSKTSNVPEKLLNTHTRTCPEVRVLASVSGPDVSLLALTAWSWGHRGVGGSKASSSPW